MTDGLQTLSEEQPPFAVDNASILESGIPVIVTVGVVSQGRILTGQRRDNRLWTSPGGHMDAGEMPREAAARELFEEAGIRVSPSQLQQISAERIISHRTGKEFAVLGFILNLDEPALVTTENDPDGEMLQWKWAAIDRLSPELHPNMRHAKKDSILAHLGLWKEEERMELTNKQQKRMEQVMEDEPVLTQDRRFMMFIEDVARERRQLRAGTALEKRLELMALDIIGAEEEHDHDASGDPTMTEDQP